MSTLSIRWFGTSTYSVRLGKVSILTDPFVTYKSPGQVLALTGDNMRSNSDLVSSFFGPIQPPPSGIFIGHSHYDHMLDTVEALKLNKDWNGTPVYGSKTTKHILAGYKKVTGPADLNKRWSENWAEVKTSGEWEEVYPTRGGSCDASSNSQPYRVCYKAFNAEHAPHLPPFKFFSGELTSDLQKPPKIAKEFPEGGTFVYLFKLTTKDAGNEASYTVGLIGAATKLPEGLEGFNEPVDVLILCVPGWNFISGYPGNFIKALKPRFIVLSHYDNFFEPDRNKRPTRFVPTAKFYKFLNVLQDEIQSAEEYDRFEKVLIPDVGATMYLGSER